MAVPELPEVETVRRTLEPLLAGRTVSAVELLKPDQIRHPDPVTFRAEMEGRRFAHQLGRRGKYLLLHLEGGGTVVCHLRMSGQLYVSDPAAERRRHTHVVMHLDNGMELRYVDQRTFGGFHLVYPDGTGTPAGLRNLGPEPLAADWTPDYLSGRLKGRRTPVKAALLDQAVAAGLGNIYVDETLFRAGVHPARQAGEVTPAEVGRIAAAARDVLEEAIRYRGTTFSLYFDGTGQSGDYYRELRVFDRDGEPCYTCGAVVEKSRVAGRGTHYCPNCQR